MMQVKWLSKGACVGPGPSHPARCVSRWNRGREHRLGTGPAPATPDRGHLASQGPFRAGDRAGDQLCDGGPSPVARSNRCRAIRREETGGARPALQRFRTGAALSDNSDSERETRIPANPGCRPFESTVTRAHSRHAAAPRGAAGRLGDPALSRFRPSHPSYSDIGPLAGLEGGRRVRPRPARSSNAARTPLSVCLSVCLTVCLSLFCLLSFCVTLSLSLPARSTRAARHCHCHGS